MNTMKRWNRLLAAILVAALLLPLFPEKSAYAAGATITDDNFLGTGQINLNVNNAGSGYDFTNALTNPKNGSNYGGVANMWELRLDGNTAACLNFGAPATKGNTYTQVGNVQSLGCFSGNATIDVDLRGLIYGYERLLGNHAKFGTSDPGYEKLSYSLRADGIMTAADCYMMMQVLTWRLTCQQYCSPSVDYEKALAREIFCDLYGGDNTNWKLNYIDEAYGYLMQCINESRSGNYNNKYSKVTIYYYRADGESNQDLMIWDVWKQPVKTLTVQKNGKVVGLPLKSATYAVSYTSDMSYCFTQFTTNEKGKAQVELEEGTYYIRETSAPTGAMLDNNIYTLTITDATAIYNLTDSEITNYLEFNKYEAGTSNLITEEAEFDLYEWNNGLNRYLKVGAIHYDGNGKYSLNAGVEGGYSYHDENGTITRTLNTDKLFYTSVNEGKFKIVETKAPAGWRVTNKEFTMNASQDGAVISMTTSSTGIGEYPCVNALEVEKVDTFTRAPLSGAVFMVQEKVNGTWYDVGELEEITKTEAGKQIPYYRTTQNKTYSYHDANGNVYNTINNAFPLHNTTYNNGTFRVAEKHAPEDYAGGWSRVFTVTASDYHVISFTASDSAENRGKGVGLKTSKYDAVTNEKVESAAKIEVFEHIEALDEWLPVGELKYNAETKEYVSAGVLYKMHNADGTESAKGIDGGYEPGYLYYTSANKGRFKVVETKAPANYLNGKLNITDMSVMTYEHAFTITENDKDILDLTALSDAAQDTGIRANVELSKYDAITNRKVVTGDAEFTVYEQVNGQWLKAGRMIYDKASKIYKTKGMNLTLHNSAGTVIYTEKSANGLYYTTANKGKYRVAETKAPTDYLTGSKRYVKEFDITTDADGGIVNLKELNPAPTNIGVSGTVMVAKYDAVTKDKVLTGDAEFTIYEKIAAHDKWLAVGTLVYNEETEEYITDGQNFTFHDEDGNEMDTSKVMDFEAGRLYKTTANQGKFKVVETKAPANYTLNPYEQEFIINADNPEYKFNTIDTGAIDTGVSGGIQLVKADSLTEKPLAGAVFMLQEWSETRNDWLDAGILTDNLDGTYITDRCFLHTGTEGETIESKTIIYTTQNLGKFRIVETKAPEGYINEGWISQELSLTEETTEFVLDNETKVKNTPIRVSVSKKSITTGKDISGAKLTITDSDGTVIDTWITDGTEHIISAIPAGTYILTEEQAPEGYVITGSVEFEVKETSEIQKVEMFDEEVKGRLTINKVDNVTGAALAGATFELKDEEGNVIQTLISDEKGHAVSDLLNFGIYDTNGKYLGSKQYTITETLSPNGYKLDGTPVTIEFQYQDDRTEVVELNVTVKNEKEPEVPTGDRNDLLPLMILIVFTMFTISITIYCKKKDEE